MISHLREKTISLALWGSRCRFLSRSMRQYCFGLVRRLHASRSPEMVAKMEKEKGLVSANGDCR